MPINVFIHVVKPPYFDPAGIPDIAGIPGDFDSLQLYLTIIGEFIHCPLTTLNEERYILNPRFCAVGLMDGGPIHDE